jgi:septal ring factor EnvC (AmiA/AmiB activator)
MRRSFSQLCKAAALGLALFAASAAGGAARTPLPPAPPSKPRTQPAPVDSAQAKAQLAALRARIDALTNERAAELAQRDVLGARLRQAELAITAKRRSLEVLHAAVTAAERRRSLSLAEQARTRGELESERAALAGEIMAAYMIGRQEQFKLLLSQTDPSALGRLLTYYGYFGRERAAQINAIRARQQQLEAVAVEIEQQSARLKALGRDDRLELDELESARTLRLATLAALAAQVKTGDEQLASLEHQRQAVESLLAELASVLQQFPQGGEENFEQLKGRLPWPVAGRLVAHPHDPPNGIVIEASEGARVRAPYSGRVIYADWLPGLGLLLIIGHSDGYLSLYGHAEVLYKSVGDRVAPGDVVAGLSDAAARPPRLYFEIRQGRKALDTRAWLRGDP